MLLLTLRRHKNARRRHRYFAEECDALGGFQLLAHDAGGFGALTEDLLAHLRDEYARTPVVRLASALCPHEAACVAECCVCNLDAQMLFSTRPPLPSYDAAALRGTRLSTAMAAAHCAPLADVYAPLSVPPVAEMAQSGLSVDNAQVRTASCSVVLCSSKTSSYDSLCMCSGFPHERGPWVVH